MSANRNGCCVDGSCNPSTCMALPAGESCGTCRHVAKCTAMFGAKAEYTSCDFFPRRFRTPKPAAAEVTP